jgi:cell division control protein 6
MVVKDSSVFTYRFTPSLILHREKEMAELAFRMNNPLQGKPVKNTVIYGYSGTGKTLIARHLASEITKKTFDVLTCYVRMKGAQSEFKAVNKISLSLMNTEYDGRSPTSIYNRIFSYIKQLDEKYVVFIFDEIDSVTQNIDSFLDAFLRPYENYDLGDKEVSVILISNKMTFPEGISVGTKSSFACLDKLVFSPYDASHLRDILIERAEKGLKDGAYEESVIPLCAAFGAREHGDARRTIELLGKSASIAEKDGSSKIQDKHVSAAREIIEFEGISQVLKTLPVQAKAVALAIAMDLGNKDKSVRSISYPENSPTTGSIYTEYKNICNRTGMEVLTQRRIRDFLDEFESMGLLHAEVVYKGRYGRNRHVELIVPAMIIERVITGDMQFQGFKLDFEQEVPNEDPVEIEQMKLF